MQLQPLEYQERPIVYMDVSRADALPFPTSEFENDDMHKKLSVFFSWIAWKAFYVM